MNFNCMPLLSQARSRSVRADLTGTAVLDIPIPPTIQHGEAYYFQAGAARNLQRFQLPNLSNILTITDFDLDGDGYPFSGDCDDTDPAVFRGCCFPDVDTDGDQQCDAADPCPLSPLDDRDGDGVCDDVDPCPDDDPDDSDGDGSCDSVDPCPIDPLDDRDGDGVCDSLDVCSNHSGQPEDEFVFENGWNLVRRVTTPAAPWAAHFGVADHELYVARRAAGTTGGLYRIEGCTGWTKLANHDNPASILPHSSGAVFVSEDFDGEVWRWNGGASSSVWASGWHSGDDDPSGMACADADHTGPLTPDTCLMVDRGNNGADDIWSFSPNTSQGETVFHSDNGTLIDAFDLAVTGNGAYVVDASRAALYELGAGGTLTEIPTSMTLSNPVGVAWDRASDTLLVADSSDDVIYRVDPDSGATSIFAYGMPVSGWSAVDVDTEGARVVVTTSTEVLVFGNCDPSLGDCDGDGLGDACQLEMDPSLDCDGNGVLDTCDLASGAADCDGNGILDACPSCPPLDVAIVIDTSDSMVGEGQALCARLSDLRSRMLTSGVAIDIDLLALDTNNLGSFPCVNATVEERYGTVVPGNPAANLATFGACPGGNEVQAEDWGRGTALVAGERDWSPGAVRVIVPLFDEGPWCGAPETAEDDASIAHAITVANDNGVRVYPLAGGGTNSAVLADADALAAGTGGIRQSSSTSSEVMLNVLLELSNDACGLAWDCNATGEPDTCEIADGTVDDCDGDAIPDACATGVADGVDDGVCN
jgi:hypothetical protein